MKHLKECLTPSKPQCPLTVANADQLDIINAKRVFSPFLTVVDSFLSPESLVSSIKIQPSCSCSPSVARKAGNTLSCPCFASHVDQSSSPVPELLIFMTTFYRGRCLSHFLKELHFSFLVNVLF